jgi:hypothetical protein
MTERQKPTLIRAQVVNEDGSVEDTTVNVEDIRGGVRRHESLPSELTERVNKLYPRVGNLIQPSAAKWLEMFLFDSNPEGEVIVWERIADVADALWVDPPSELRSKNDSVNELRKLDRKTLVRVVLCVSMNMVDIPSQVRGVTDRQVELVRTAYQG